MSLDRPCYLAELVAATDAAGTLATLRYATVGYNTRPGDVPPSTHYAPRIAQPALVRRDMFSAGRTSGRTNVGYGELRLINRDGALDAIKDYGFDGRALTIRFGNSQAPYATFTTVLSATMEQVDLDESTAVVRVKDKLLVLANPLATALYGGTNALPAGVDGTADDIKGAPKPRLFGTVLNAVPVLVNTSRLIYQINDGAVQTIAAVYDRGAALAKGADYVSQADMEATAPAAGGWRCWPAGGMFRLGSAATGQITADASQGATAADRTCAQILKAIALAMDVAAGDISAADVAALDAANGAEIGVYVTDGTEALQIMDEVAESIGAWYGFDRSGALRMGRLVAPAGAPVADLTVSNITDLKRVTSRDDSRGLPVWRVTLGYARVYQAQDTDLAGSVSAARRALLMEQYRRVASEDANVKAKYLTAGVLERDSLIVNAAAAAAEAARLLALFKVRRDTYTVSVRLTQPLGSGGATLLATLDLGSVVRLTHRRFGLQAGKLMVVLGLQVDFQRNRAELTLWG